MSAVAPVAVHRALAAEDAARADFYALLARLFAAPPDSAVLASLAAAGPIEGGRDLPAAWRDLVDASSVMDADAAAEEYERLFVGIGKSVVSIYAGYYSGATAVEHPRVRIQNDLAELGLARTAASNEPEDHFAGLFEVMRVLVAGGAGRAPAPLGTQKRFFASYLDPAAARFMAAVGVAAEANYYRHVAAVGQAFMAIEMESFELE